MSEILRRPAPDMDESWSTLVTSRLPSTAWRSPKSRSSVVPVATAMVPEYVEHEPRAEASPAFWMVVVPPLPHC